jgi:cell division protein ZapB
MMISEFELLGEKVKRLAELTQSLRLENATLRRDTLDLLSENKDLRERVQNAHDRVEVLLAHLPEDGEAKELA